MGGDTVAWVNATLQQLPLVPSLAFVHIPVPQVGGWLAACQWVGGWASGFSIWEPLRLFMQVLAPPCHPQGL